MSNPTPNNTAMLEMLAGLVESIVSTMPAELKKSFDELSAQTSAAMTGKKDEAAAADSAAVKDDSTPCDCLACRLKEEIFGNEAREVAIGFDMHLAGQITMDIARQVGGIKPGSTADTDAERTMAALLIVSSKDLPAKTPDAQILQQQAIEHITKGILALNGLRATAA